MAPKKKPRLYPAPEANGDAKADQEEAQPKRVEEEKIPTESKMVALFIDRIMRFAVTADGGDDNHPTKDGPEKEMPQFGRLSFYFVKANERDALWRFEAERLMKAARGTVDGLVFPSKQAPAPLDHQGFAQLAKVANTILSALHICFLDDQMALEQFHSPSFDAVGWSQIESALRNRIDDSYNLPGRGKSFVHPGSEAFASRNSMARDSQDGWEATGYYGEERGLGRMRRQSVVMHDTITARDRLETVREDDEDSTVEVVSQKTNGEEMKKPDARKDDEDGERKTAATGKQANTGKLKEEEKDVEVGRAVEMPEKYIDHPNRLGAVTDPEVYCAIVDHITAVLARIATECAPSSYWRTVVLACLVKLSTKLKVVTIDLPAYVRECLQRSETSSAWQTARKRYEEAAAASMPVEDWADEVNEWQFSRITDDDAAVPRYCVENATVGGWLIQCIAHALVDLGAQLPLHAPLDRLDLCALVFRAGARGLPTLIHQDRHGNIGGSCEALPLVFSTSAMHLAADLGKEVEKQAQALPNKAPAADGAWDTKAAGARMEISWEKDRQDGGLDIERAAIALPTVADVVTVLVPLSLVKPPLAQDFRRVLQVMSALSAFGEISPPTINFTASVSLLLDKNKGPAKAESEELKGLFKNRLSRHKLQPDTEVVADNSNSLSASLLANRRLNLFDHSGPDIMFSADKETVEQTIEDANARLAEMSRITKDWDIDGIAVVVKCPVYVWLVVVFCAILVTGGLLIGFLVGDRIRGVDPFGIATFTWVIAGFVILVAKSVRVSDWPWQEFLRGRVTCRSVTELRSVTGMNEQDIIRFFVSTQDKNNLTTRGPFNKPFRTNDKEGFSIDIKPELETLISCGLIPIKVSTLQGPSLVYLDLTRGARRLTSVDHLMRPYTYCLCCFDPPAAEDRGDATLSISPYVIWIKILGLYNCKGMKFR